MEIAYPFTIYKNAEDEMCLAVKKPLIHLNTLAQICFRAYSQAPDLPMPKLIILDHKVVKGVSQSGRFEIDFKHSYFKKVGEIGLDLTSEKRFRLGLLYENAASKKQEEQLVECYQNAILLHGELTSVLQKKQNELTETAIQWITA